MRVGVPRETWPGETRVSLIPSAVAPLKKAGLDVVVEQDAGTAAGFPSTAYEQAGASVASRDEVYATSDIVLQVRSIPSEGGRLRRGQVVIKTLEKSELRRKDHGRVLVREGKPEQEQRIFFQRDALLREERRKSAQERFGDVHPRIAGNGPRHR